MTIPYKSIFCSSVAIFLLSGCADNTTTLDDSEDSSKVIEESIDLEKPIKEVKNFQFRNKVHSESYAEKSEQFIQKVVTTNQTSGENFRVMAMVVDEGMMFISDLGDAYSKRFTDKEIREQFFISQRDFIKGLPILLQFTFVGPSLSDIELEFNEKSYQYFFLENEKGDFVRASSQEIEGFMHTVSSIYEDLQVVIYFPHDEVIEMMKNSEKLYLTFDGLNINEEDRIELLYPFNKYYQDIFPNLDGMIEDIKSSI